MKIKYELGDEVTFTPLKSLDGKDLPSRMELEKLMIDFKAQIDKDKVYNLEEKKFQELLKLKKPKSEYEIMKLIEEFPFLKSETIKANGGQEEWEKKLDLMKKNQAIEK